LDKAQVFFPPADTNGVEGTFMATSNIGAVRPSGASFRKMTAEEVIAQMKDLPIVSETARKVVTLLNDSETPHEELVKTLRCDNVLTAKLLRLCNSAQIGLERPVASIDLAILHLGYNAIYRMVSTISFGSVMGYGQPGQSVEMNGLWAHSLSIGLGSEYLTETESYGQCPPSIAFTAGLLHDIGKLPLNRVLTPKIRAAIRDVMTRESLPRVAAEKAVLGVNHAEVGACLLQSWALPAIIVEAVANHHAPVVQPEVHLSAVVYLSNCSFHLAGTGMGWDAYAVQVSQSSAAMLGLEVEKVAKMIANAQEAMKAVNKFLHVA
jgi:putative nucleotidyltransferase with HDIG domain